MLITNNDAYLWEFEQLIIMYPAIIYVFLITVLVAYVNAIVPTHNSAKGLRPWLQSKSIFMLQDDHCPDTVL